jgi:hypothetical protein
MALAFSHATLHHNMLLQNELILNAAILIKV